MLHSSLENPSQCIIRHCVIGGEIQPVYFSLTLIRDKQHNPAGFTCTILPVLSCDCTGNCNSSRKCSGCCGASGATTTSSATRPIRFPAAVGWWVPFRKLGLARSPSVRRGANPFLCVCCRC